MSAEKQELVAIHKKLDALLEHRKVSLKDIRVSLVGVFMGLLTLGAPSAAVIANHYAIKEHLVNTRIHAEEAKSEHLGGVAYSGEVAHKERQIFFAMKALHCGSVQNATQAICSSAYPDGPFPEFPSSAHPSGPFPEFLLGRAWGAGQPSGGPADVPGVARTSSGTSGGK